MHCNVLRRWGGIPLGTSNMDIKSKNKDKVVDTQTRRDKTNLHTVSMFLLSEAKSVFKTVAAIVQKVALSRPGGVWAGRPVQQLPAAPHHEEAPRHGEGGWHHLAGAFCSVLQSWARQSEQLAAAGQPSNLRGADQEREAALVPEQPGGCPGADTRHLSPVTCHLPPATCHLPPATCHLSPVTSQLDAERAAQSSNYRQLELARGVRGAAAETLEECAARYRGEHRKTYYILYILYIFFNLDS